jgi:hypothetical protein
VREEVEPHRERAKNIAGTLQRAVAKEDGRGHRVRRTHHAMHAAEKPVALLAETLAIKQMSGSRTAPKKV